MEKSYYHEELDETEVDVEDPDEDDSLRVQREHMLELYSGDYPALKLAYEDWERTSGSLQRRVKHGTEVASFAKKEVCHLFWLFVVVEGVLLTTLWQAQLLKCESSWICFYLSFLASLVLLIPLVQRILTYWNVQARIGSLLLALEEMYPMYHVKGAPTCLDEMVWRCFDPNFDTSSCILSSRILKKEAPDINYFNSSPDNSSSWTDSCTLFQVLSRRIHVMKTLGPLECTFDEKADDVVMHEVLKKPGMSSTITRMAVITTTILAIVLLLMLGIQVRCDQSMKVLQRLQMFLKFSPVSLTP